MHSYPDAGHYILEDMKDEVVPLIENFLDTTNLEELGANEC